MPGIALCAGCVGDLPRIGPACPNCGLPSPEGRVCGPCLRRPPPYAALRAPFRYQTPLDWLVQGFKFDARMSHGRVLAELLRRHWTVAGAAPPEPGPDLLIPVPLHPSRLRERGFNQAVELFRPLAADLGVPIALDAVRRQVRTGSQAGLDARARRRNVRGAFALRGEVDGLRVAVLDDVVTTGSTVAELARVLRRGGARRVEVWALARTVMP